MRFMAVSDFGVRNKNHLKPDSSGSILTFACVEWGNSPLPGHRRSSNARGLPGGGGGGGDVEVLIRSTHKPFSFLFPPKLSLLAIYRGPRPP